MKKEFDRWCKFKKELNQTAHSAIKFFKVGEIWWASLGVNIGIEIDGTGKELARPILVLKKYNRQALLALPLTGQDKSSSKHHYALGDVRGKKAYVILSQARVIDAVRLQERVLKLSEARLSNVSGRFLEYNFSEKHK